MLMLGTVICVINYILLWFGAVWSPVGKYAIVYITYILLGWTFDIMDISLNKPASGYDYRQQGEKISCLLIKAIGYTIGGMGLSVVEIDYCRFRYAGELLCIDLRGYGGNAGLFHRGSSGREGTRGV